MLPTIVLFWQENGLSIADVFLLQGLFAIANVLLELPMGVVADRAGKRASLLAGMSLAGAGFVVYALSFTFAGFALAELILALALSLISGADTALLYDSLKAVDREEDFQRIEGQARALQMVSVAISCLAGGFIATYGLRLTLWATLLGPTLALPVLLGMKEIQPLRRSDSFVVGFQEYWKHTASSLRFVWRHGLVRWQVAFMAVISGSSTWLLWLYQPYMEFTELPLWAFGVAFASFNLVAALASNRAHDVDKTFGQNGTVIFLMSLQVIPRLLMSAFRFPLAFVFIWGHQIARGLVRTVIGARILRYTFADKRATVLSMGSMAGRIFFAATAPLVGLVTESTGLVASLLSQAGALMVVFALLWWAYRRIPGKYFEIKKEVSLQQ